MGNILKKYLKVVEGKLIYSVKNLIVFPLIRETNILLCIHVRVLRYLCVRVSFQIVKHMQTFLNRISLYKLVFGH